MRKRVGLARALAMEPEVILYDEPTTGLDPIMSDVINELILRTRSSYPVTSIVVTHDMRTAKESGQSGRHALSVDTVWKRGTANHLRWAT